MSRVAVPYTSLTVNGAVADPTGIPVFSGTFNGAQVPAVLGDQSQPERTLLRVQCGATPGSVTVHAGQLPLAIAAGLGDLVISLAGNATQWVGPLESGRFIQSDGTLLIDVTQSMTITAFRIPRH